MSGIEQPTGTSAEGLIDADQVSAGMILRQSRLAYHAGWLPEWIYKVVLKAAPDSWYPEPQAFLLRTEIEGREIVLRHQTDDTLGREAWLYGYYDRLVLGLLREAIKRVEAPRSASTAFYDIGANIGNHTVFLADLFGDVYCFEPNPKALEILELNLEAIPNARIFPFGLSQGDSELAFMTGSKSNLGNAHIVAAPAASGSQTKIRVCNGDALIEAEGLQPPTLLKIDVEGHEAQVFAGLDQTIARHTPLIVFEMLERTLASSAKFAERLRDLGYAAFRLTGLDPARQLTSHRNRLVLTPYDFDEASENVLAIPPRYRDQLMEFTR